MRLVLHEFLERSARANPDDLAVVDGDTEVTYAELDERSNRVANLLRGVGVSQGDRVAAYVDKSAAAVVGLYGIMKAGAAYVPLDPKAPTARLGLVAKQAGTRVLLGSRSRSGRWPALMEAGAPLTAAVSIDGEPKAELDGVHLLGPDDIAEATADHPGVAVDEDDLAYILFTSGSTGVPKGVTLSHRNGGWFARWAADTLSLTREDRLSSHAPFHFDLSVFDLYASSFAGSSVHIVRAATSMFPVELAHFIRSHELTVWYSVPTILRQLHDNGEISDDDFPSLRAVVFAGEVFPAPALAALMTRLTRPEYWNWYGPTETNVCTAYRVAQAPPVDGGDIPIGIPISGTEALVLADDGTEAGVGEPGELLIAGPTVTRGYWGDDERTAAALVANPLAPEAGPMYRTGDLVVRGTDGALTYVGRRDNQIKSRGYRIDLGDIETTIHHHPDVIEAAVVAVSDPDITNRLHAFVVVREGTTTADVIRHCRDLLPAYMLPGAVELLATLPRTSNDKIDRVNLTERAALQRAGQPRQNS